mmetsp:Transcript_9465/g.23670  ORF Transcript_9465/g.23670 Transcript_9465/m.23670 type:complete len:312 (+) Transcript_9465:876-1811(+)
MYTRQTNQTKVAQHQIGILSTELAIGGLLLLGRQIQTFGVQDTNHIRFVHQSIQVEEDTLDVPDLRVSFQKSDFILTFGLEFATVLAELLELVDELIDDIPQPGSRKLETLGRIRIEEVVEEESVVLPALETMLTTGLKTRVHMTKVEFAVEHDEHGILVDQLSYRRDGRPCRVGKVLLGEIVERCAVDPTHLENVLLLHVAVQDQNEVAHNCGHGFVYVHLATSATRVRLTTAINVRRRRCSSRHRRGKVGTTRDRGCFTGQKDIVRNGTVLAVAVLKNVGLREVNGNVQISSTLHCLVCFAVLRWVCLQ